MTGRSPTVAAPVAALDCCSPCQPPAVADPPRCNARGQLGHPAPEATQGQIDVFLVNSHTNAASKRWHLWEIDLRFAPNSTHGRLVLHWEGAICILIPSAAKCIFFKRSAEVVTYTARPRRQALVLDCFGALLERSFRCLGECLQSCLECPNTVRFGPCVLMNRSFQSCVSRGRGSTARVSVLL